MSQTPVPPGSRLNVRGAVDLSSLARPATPQPGTTGGLPVPGPYTLDVDTASFNAVVQASTQYPVVLVLWAPWSQVSQGVAADLDQLATADAGRWLLARVDAEANPQVAQAVQAPSVPVVIAVLAGRPLPLFEGAPSREQMRDVLDQVLAAAASNGVAGSVPAHPAEPQAAAEPAEPPLPPLHQAAYDAFARDDLPAARAAYEQALKENPRDAMARAGLAQVGLFERTAAVDPVAARAVAAARPSDPDAQLVVADLDMLGGRVDDAFGRLLDVVRVTRGEDRERVRVRLVDLFEVAGPDDPRVAAARRTLASALY